MSKLEKQKEKARSLETKDPRGAIEAWLEALKAQEADAEPNPDLSIFNRIGDLYLKVKDPAQAADYYDRAVDKYAELGFHNNAIAMCNKVLRNAPARQTTYLKLAKLSAAKGFMAEAKQHFLEYAERMQKTGKIQQAFAALKEFADISPESAHLREMLEEHLRMYGDPERRPVSGVAPPAKPEPREDTTKTGKHKTPSPGVLDVDEPTGPRRPRGVKGRPSGGAPPPRVTPVVPKRPAARPAVGSPPRMTGPKAPAPTFEPPRAEPPKVKPVVPKRPAASPPASPKRKTMAEVPPLELEPDFDTTATDQAHEVDEQPLATDETPTADPPITPSGRRRAAFDFGLDGVVNQGAAADRGSLVFANIEATPTPPTIEELEARVADDPDDPEAHQALGEALIEAGERDRGTEELDHATTGFENRGNLPHAQDLVDEILRLDPNSVRHRQKQVEFAFKSGDKAKLIEAYLELADTLLRSDLPDKARAVYQRVAEHDPGNVRATAAIAMLAPVAPAPPKPKAKTPARDAEQKTAARDAKMKVRDEAVEAGDFVDLSAMILDDELPARDTRMKVADEEPTGDEEQDFQDMLQRFKQGIDENIDEADFQSHYDLGVAFKESGRLDEAIAELRKALRAPEGKLRSSE